ncbi:hypothetical protein CERZMDRAFT_110098 [Cercospora zeae-maydis SCOH1-5]|uniref:NAD-dependent epimerase/dehydratase domain-containing protein n=1 Tax=Cercospora zeae-maydis SCOH1-5 TaxID=717836 RepID=A0A6A6FQD1_9PEZI|nr:hypothetical protein CERZMDRAFT_110098 [Cercospora zeae-maydis SCOH1-5]
MATTRRKTVLVTGANGFIGNAVAKAFVAAGYTTYGLVRQQDAMDDLAASEITPILGTPDDTSQWLPQLQKHGSTAFDIIVSSTENLLDYQPHFDNVLRMLVTLCQSSKQHGVRPLVLFASGCKDYGKGDVHPHAAPFTEESPLRPGPVLAPRCSSSLKLFDHTDLFDAVVVRPTTLYGGSSSYYGAAFEVGAAAAAKPQGRRRLTIAADPNSIVHGTHVADVASAYIALAQHEPRTAIASQCFNISALRYETAQQVADAIVAEYQLEGADFVETDLEAAADKKVFDVVGLLFGFSQWVGSEKLRTLIPEWTDIRPGFCEALRTYRTAYEAASRADHSNVRRLRAYIDLWENASA